MTDNDVNGQVTGSRRRAWRHTAVPLVALAAVVGLTACGGGSSGPGVAGGGPASQPATQGGGSQSGSVHDEALAYSRCMRSHGVPDFPDPDSSGVLSLRGVDKNAPRFQPAQNACKSLNPAGNVSPAQQAQVLAQMVTFAKCMRAHGVPRYPDPQANGNGPIALMGLGGNPAEGGIPKTPQSERAWQSCQHYLSGAQPPGSGSGS